MPSDAALCQCNLPTPWARRRNNHDPDAGHFLTLGAILFALSVIGIFLNRKNLIVC
jgi:hypothetical protein